ncbi:MAG: hypothetical protein D6728_18620 [Cyanobacteria bacterium J055]|nr:MAG: hypothetical protein D6728_18620 [Cyanobacteria bacterium J055]
MWSGYWVAQLAKQAFFPAHTLELRLSGLFVLLVLWEFVRPGATFGAIKRVAILGVRWLRRPFQVTVGRVSVRQVAGLSALVGLLVILLHQRATDGLLELFANQGRLVARQLSLLLFLPIAMIVSCVRLPGFQYWEKAAIDSKFLDRCWSRKQSG